MNPENIFNIVELDPMELAIPEPLEAWTLLDFTKLELLRPDDSDLE